MNYDLIISAYRPYFIQARTLLEKYVLMVHTFLLAVGIAWVYRIRLYHRHSPPGPFGNNVKPLEYLSILTRPCSSGIFSIDQIQCQKSFWNQNPAYVHKLCAMLANFTQKYGNVVMFRSWGGVVNVFINSPEDIAFVVPNVGRYSDAIENVFRRFQLPYHFRRGRAPRNPPPPPGPATRRARLYTERGCGGGRRGGPGRPAGPRWTRS